MKFGPILLLILSLALIPTARATPIEVIQLQHRTAEELLPLIQPHLPPAASASGGGYQLIIKAESAELAALQQLIRELDRPRRSILLTLRHAETDSVRDRHAGTAGSSRSGHVRITRSDSARSEHGERQMRGLEGRPLRIDTQILLPIRDRLVWLDRGGASSQTQIHHLELDSGLYALAQVQGDWVEVEIMVQDRPTSQPLHSRRVLTTVSGRLGEWLPLARMDAGRQASEHGIVYRSQSADQQAGALWLRVEALD